MLPRATEGDAIEMIKEGEKRASQSSELSSLKHRQGYETLDGFGEPDNGRKILRSSTTLILVTAAKQNGFWQKGGTNIEQASALGAVKFVGAKRNKVGIELVNRRKWQLAEPLDRIGVKKDTSLTADRA